VGALARGLPQSRAEENTMKRMLGMIIAAAIGLSACAHAHEGPMEKAGRKTDDAADDVKSGTKKAADDVKGD
jgi:hypothetical protein